MNDATIAEKYAWRDYRDYCRTKCSPYFEGVTGFSGDATSRALWRLWKAAYETRREAARPFYRRSTGIRFWHPNG